MSEFGGSLQLEMFVFGIAVLPNNPRAVYCDQETMFSRFGG